MAKTVSIHDLDYSQDDESSNLKKFKPKSNLNLVSCDVPIKFCDYKISNSEDKMIKSVSSALSTEGILLQSPYYFEIGTLLRVWIELPDYWMMKSKKVNYKHTHAPKYFQILTRVARWEEQHQPKFHFLITCENLTIDPVDEAVLNDFLFSKKSS